jgi:DNA-binding MarR family transcriptional regulator
MLRDIADQSGLTLHQLVALRTVRDGGRLNMSELTDELGITRGAVTGLVDRLEEGGFLVRKPSPMDRRLIFLELTATGKKTLDDVREAWDEEASRWLERVPEPTREELIKALVALVAAT